MRTLAAIEKEFTTLTIKRNTLLSFHLKPLEKLLLSLVTQGRIIQLLTEALQLVFERTNGFATLVVILLNLRPLDIDLLLGRVSTMILLEKRLHIYRGYLQLILRGSGHGEEQKSNCGRKELAEIHVLGVSESRQSGEKTSSRQTPSPYL